VLDCMIVAMNSGLAALAAVYSSVAASVAAQPLQAISIILSVIVLLVIVHVNIIRPMRRRKALKRPVRAWFILPSTKHHGCDFAVQDDKEHSAKTIVLPPFTDILIDLSFFPKLFFTNSELVIGCGAEDGPRPIEYHNRFVEQIEKQRIVPGPQNQHYTDKHGFYHYKDSPPRAWSRGTHRAVAFKFRTQKPGRYPVTIFFIGDEVEGENSELTIVVESSPKTAMKCVRPEHKKQSCASRGIKPLENGAAHQ
jgi:hypothetical protein